MTEYKRVALYLMMCCVLLCASLFYSAIPVGTIGSSNCECDFETILKCLRWPDQCIDQCSTIGGEEMR